MYEELREDYYCEDCQDDTDYQYDMMRDDFMMIENEDDAISCINRYPSQLRFLPDDYVYLLNDHYSYLLKDD